MTRLLHLFLFFAALGSLKAQTPADGLVMAKKDFCVGFLYSHDSWSEYWEGALKRSNGNIGTVTTQSVSLMGVYGVNEKINVLFSLPYVWTQASAGTLSGQSGIQDLMVALKYNALKKTLGKSELNLYAVGGLSTPMSNYTPDFLPMSIGLGSKTASLRATLNYRLDMGLYANASSAYTWRSNVDLDRPAYYYDGELINSSEVNLSNTLDCHFSIGYWNNGLQVDLFYDPFMTLGGDDIRRQDMPFVANNMDADRAGIALLYHFAKPANWVARLGVSRVVSGRNVGESTTVMGGVFYTFHF